RAAFRISNEAEPFAQGHGPGLRALYDIADLEKSRFIIGPGQSGRLFSDNRSSMTKPWRDGGLISLAPLTSPTHVLTLEPEAAP
ncbi:MAG: penicillin acylase family protein, partial [Alphaproteobacteria bacterium]